MFAPDEVHLDTLVHTIALNMEETCCEYCSARDIAMPYSPLSLFQVAAVAEMAAVSSATL